MTLTIGVDIGGTKVAGGVVDPQGRILEQHRIITPARDAQATTDAIVRVIEERSGVTRPKSTRWARPSETMTLSGLTSLCHSPPS